MSHLTEIMQKLDDLGLGDYEVSIKRGSLPATPAVCCAVYPAGGHSPDMGLGDALIRTSKPTVQVVFRGAPKDFDGPFAKAEAAIAGLAAVQAATLTGGGTGAFYHQITPQQSEPFELKRDELERVLIACNFEIEKDPSA